MKYMGSKASIARSILPIILDGRIKGQYYIEPFVGGCNSIDKVVGRRIAGDVNCFLISMWKYLQQGWIPPEFISRDLYSSVREDYNKGTNKFEKHFVGYVGFNGSYGGRFFDGGYAGSVVIGDDTCRNYPREAYRAIMGQVFKIRDVEFHCCSYENLPIPSGSIIYCDPPYKGTKRYSVSKFDHSPFWDWCREKSLEGHSVFVSEYEAPGDFTCVWEKPVSSSLRANGSIKGRKLSVERLFTV